MLFGLPIELLIGPASGLLISLVFAGTFYHLFQQLMNRLIKVFEQEIEGCNARYQQILDELLRLKETN